MMGHIIEWYYNGIAGIIPEEPGFKKITIRPYLPETIHEFSCSYASISGVIKVYVKEMEDGIILKTETPENVKCETNISNLLERGKKIRILI